MPLWTPAWRALAGGPPAAERKSHHVTRDRFAAAFGALPRPRQVALARAAKLETRQTLLREIRATAPALYPAALAARGEGIRAEAERGPPPKWPAPAYEPSGAAWLVGVNAELAAARAPPEARAAPVANLFD